MNSPQQQQQQNSNPPHPRGSMWGFRGGGGQKFKSPGNVMDCQIINNHFNPPSHAVVGSFRAQHFQKGGTEEGRAGGRRKVGVRELEGRKVGGRKE